MGEAIARYHNRSVDVLQVIQELIKMAKDLQAQPHDDMFVAERSFYDALAQNESAVEVLKNDQLKVIAAELVKSVRENSGVDWWQREDVRARMRVSVKRILRQFGYPPDLQAEAVQLILKQAEAMAQSF
jgi:type I restriction enzyme R subunit